MEKIYPETNPPQLTTITSIAGERRRWFWRIAMTSLLVVLVVAVFAFSFLDFKSPLSSFSRWFVWAAMIGVGLYFLIRNWRSIFSQFTDSEAAQAMESARPDVGQKIRTALEVTNGPPVDECHGFRDRLVSETEAFLTEHDWKSLIPQGRGLRWLMTLGVLAGVLFVSSKIWPEYGLGVKRILFPNTATTYTQVAWENPPEWFDQRHPPLLQVKVSGREAVPELKVKEYGADDWETVALKPRDNSPIWDAVLTGREISLAAIVTAGDGKTELLALEYEPIPELREATVTLDYPTYIERESETRPGGDGRALEGTKATWTFVFNTAPAEVKWEIGEAAPELLASAETCVTSVHTIDAGTRNPVLTVTDRRGRPVDSWRFEIEGLVDQLPEIEILEPAKDRDATSITEIPVRIRAKDDYGLGEVGVVLEAAGETKWILEKVINTGNQRQANEMIHAMLEEIPLEITDNVRLYAYALDRKPRGGPRALSHLRSIDIRQFKRRWRFQKLPPMAGGGPKMEDIAGLETIIKQQRDVVSQVFVLKGGGRDSISQELFEKCNGEAAKEDSLSLDVSALVEKWIETGRIEQDDITLLEVAGEQMVQAGKELRVPDRDAAFEVADSSLSNLLRLRKRLMTLILKANSKEGEPMDPKEQPPPLTDLAKEARRLALEEADVRAQLEDEELAKSTDPGITRRQQDVAIYDAGELYAKLLTHPERTEGALDLMDEAEGTMQAAGGKLQSETEAGAVLDLALAEQRLLELAEFLTILEMQMASEALEKMASELEKEAEELTEQSESEGKSEGESDSDSKGDEQSESEDENGKDQAAPQKGDDKKSQSKSDSGKKSAPKSGQAKSSSSGKTKGKGQGKGNSQGRSEAEGQEGDTESTDVGDLLTKASRRARLTDEVLKALAEREANRGMRGGNDGEDNKGEGKNGKGENEGTLGDLRRGLAMGDLAKALEKLAEAKKGEGKQRGGTDDKGDEVGKAGEGGKGEEQGKEKGKGGSDGNIAALAGQLGEAGNRMRELARELNSSQLSRLAEVKEEINKLKQQFDSQSKSGSGKADDSNEESEEKEGGEGEGEENPFAALLGGGDPSGEKEGRGKGEGDGTGQGNEEKNDDQDRDRRGFGPPTEAFAARVERVDDETVRRWGRMLRDVPFDRSTIPILEAIEKRVDELVGEIPQVTAVAGGRRTVPEESRREIEDYFRDLSDDFGNENWMKRE